MAAAVFGLVWFWAQTWMILDPTNIVWVEPGSDYGFHLAGWQHFRASHWHLWPLGFIDNMQWPAGSTVGFNDGVPWLALIMKLLSPVLPANFQYIGIWLAICFALQGWFGARLAQAISPSVSPITAAIAGAFFVFSPILVHRVVHEALCAHFLILAAMAMCLRPPPRWPRGGPVLLTAVAMGIHPYLAAMVVVLGIAAVLRARRPSGIPLILAVAAALAFWLGYLGWGDSSDLAAVGFGKYTTDLLSPFNPQIFSRLIPGWPTRPKLIEDPGWIGLGGVLLCASAIVLTIVAWRRKEPPLPWKRALPLMIATALLAFYAASPRIAVFGQTILDLSDLYEPFAAFTGTFRVTGRFIWPATYLIVSAGLAVWLVRRPRLAPWVLLVCAVVQVSDWRNVTLLKRFRRVYVQPKFASEWQLAPRDFDHLAMYPPRCADTSFTCCGKLAWRPRHEDMYIAALTSRLGLTLNGGGTARAFRTKLQPYCESLYADVAAARLDARTIYYVGKNHQEDFRRQNPAATCAMLDGELACVSPDARGPFRDFLAGHK